MLRDKGADRGHLKEPQPIGYSSATSCEQEYPQSFIFILGQAGETLENVRRKDRGAGK